MKKISYLMDIISILLFTTGLYWVFIAKTQTATGKYLVLCSVIIYFTRQIITAYPSASLTEKLLILLYIPSCVLMIYRFEWGLAAYLVLTSVYFTVRYLQMRKIHRGNTGSQ